MKTFFNLVQEVQKTGFCHRCGGCAAFCTAINYGALEIDKNGKPVYKDMEKCIECGLCYSICPETKELDETVKLKARWSEPIGRVIETTVVRSKDKRVRECSCDGGAVTGLLLHLFDRNQIDGAIVTRPSGMFQRHPFLATTRKEILESAGFYPDISHGLKQFSDRYKTYSPIEAFGPMVKKGLNRVALVGTPCQIKSLRKMQVLNLVPSDAIHFRFGLFCSGSITFGDKEQQEVADMAGIHWQDVARINLKDRLLLTLHSGEVKTVDLEKLNTVRQSACHYCSDYSAEFADVSFGGIGAPDGWTTVMTRTPLGRTVLAESRRLKTLEQFNVTDDPEYAGKALRDVRRASSAKKKTARYNRRKIQRRPIQVRI